MKSQKNKHYYPIIFIFTILVGIMFAQAGEMSGIEGNSGANVKPLKASHEATATPLENISPITFSSNGNALATVDNSGMITLRDVNTGLTLWDRFDPLNDVVTSLAFSLDGKTLASVGKNAVIFWEVASGQERTTIALDNATSALTQAVFSPDKKYFAAVNRDGDTFLWNFKAGLSTYNQISLGVPVGELTFSPDAKFLVGVTKGRNPKIKLWDVVTGRLQTVLSADSINTNYVFSPNSEIVASVGQRGIITLWNPHSGTIKRILNVQEQVTAVAFSPDSKTLAVGCNGEEPKIQLWNPVTGELIFNQPAEDGSVVTNLLYSPDGSILASISKDNHISLWDVLRGELKQLLVGQDEDIIKAAAFNSKQPALAAVGKDGRLIVWDLVTGLEQHSFQIPTLLSAALVSPKAPLFQSGVSGVNSQLATTNSPSAATSSSLPAVVSSRVAGPATSKLKKRNPQKWKGIKALAISQDGTELGAAGDDGIIRVFKKNGKQRWNISGHHGNTITGLAFRGKTKQWVSAGRDTEIKTWDDVTGNNLQTFYGPEHPPRTVAVSPNGQFIATAGEETRVFLFDAVAGKLSKIFSGHIDFVNALAFSPDGKTLVSAGAEGRTFLWEVNTGKPLRTLLGHSGEVNAVAFSPDGTLLATASEDSTVILWNLTSGRQIKTLTGHQGSVRSVAFSPNGKKLVSAGEDTRLMVWDSTTWQLRKQLTGPPAAVNVLAFDPIGNLHVGSENSEVSEVNTDTGSKVDSIVVPVVPATSTLVPQVSSGTRMLPPVIPRQGIASLRQSHSTLSAMFNQILDWMIPSAEAALPPNQGPGGPILIVTTAADHFGEYYAEILRTEGFNEFAVTDISTVTEVTLAPYDVVILAEMPLNADQELTFNNWVNGGGNLIAMRPDKGLASLLGLTDANSTLSNAYLLTNTSASPGSGIVGETMQFHGIADRYTLSGAVNIATLYSNAVTATSNPAVTLRKNIGGIGGGQAAAFTYDLAKSIVYTHQGNPAWATQERDGFSPKRSDDKFYGDAAGDPQLDWIDLSKVMIPQADEQQRLLGNLILEMNHEKKPLPRFWYFPRGLKAVVIMTGDDHANNGTPGRFDAFLSSSAPGCVVEDWECVRGTSYIYPNTALTNLQAANYNAQGFEVGLHVNTNCADFTPAQLEGYYVDQISSWTTKYSSIPAPITQRHHCIAWSDWATAAKVQLAHGIRLDTSYYFWPPNWVLNKPGFFSGSGMPMRFADVDGSFIDVYQATSQMTDESGQSYPFTINSLLDKAIGQEAYYGAFTVNAHTDVSTTLESVTVVESAFAHSVPVITSRQMMDWLDYRNSSFFGGVTRNGNTLSFSVNLGTSGGSVPANSALKNSGLQVLLPMRSTVGVLNSLMLDGVAKPFTSTTVKGVEYAAFSGVAGNYVAIYAADTTAPTVTATSPTSGASGIGQTAVVTATFSEAVNPATVNASTFELRDASNNLVAAAISYNTNTRTAALTPSASLTANATYTATVKGGTTDPRVNDLAGNALAANVTWSFTTQTQPCAASSCSAWLNSTTPGNPQENDPNSVELGVKFRSDIAGSVTGIRFYQTNSNAGAGRTFQATLWDFVTQAPLATGTITTTASGWLQVNFPTSFAISANTVYVASYHAPNGNYAGDNGFFTASGIDNAPLHLLKDGENGGNGVYAYGVSRAYPSNTWQASNYWVDVVFSTNVGSDTTAPTVTSTVPTTSAAGINPANPVMVTFSEAMATASISGSTFQLMDSVNEAVSATVTYGAGSNTATLSPTIPLTESTTYTAKVIGGVNGAKDLAGNPLEVDKTWTFTTGVDPCSIGSNPIVCENSKSGNPPSEWDISGAGDSSIQGYATDISFNRGETVRFKVNTPSTDYRLDIYRMGYYAGNGARKVATVQPSVALPQSQPNCFNHSVTGLVDCGLWSESASWLVPTDATSGIYFAKAVREDGANTGASHIVFIVRDDASTSDILFQTADTTWQAYNNYGGNSLYAGSPVGRAYKVSYNRPFNTRNVDGGQDWVFNAEYPMVRWLEANGYNVSYFTGVDSDRFGSLIRNHKLFMSNAHDEYWSAQQRANVEAARDSTERVNLAFFSGNEVFWKTRWENNITNSNGALGGDSNRTLVCYKETHAGAKIDPLPNVWTGTWRDPRFSPPADGGRPENALMGTIFTVNDGATTSIRVPEADGKMRFWRNTSIAGLAPGATEILPLGTLGYEWDEDLDNGFRPAGLVRLSTTIVPNAPVLTDYGSNFGSGTANHALTLYKANSGAIVFGAGTVQWAWGLDSNHDRTLTPTNVAMQQATVNLFADMLVQPGTLQPGLSSATASSDTALTPPISVISSPASGANIALGSVVIISGTASDAGGGRVGGVEVSVDGGVKWHPATGRATWTYSWTAPSTSGQVNIKSRAVDDSLNLETPGFGVTVNVGTDPDLTPPTVPGSLSATPASGILQVNLAWTTSTDASGIAGYHVERCQNAGCTDFTEITISTALSFSDSGLTEGITYRYRVRAFDNAGNPSTYTNIATAILDATAPGIPGGLSATATSDTQVNLTWTASLDNVAVTGYRVERCQGAGCSVFTQIATPATASFVNSGLTGGTTYQYRVQATDAAGNLSAFSNVATVTTQSAQSPPVATADTFLFRASLLRTINNTGPLGVGVLANDTDTANLPLTAQAVGGLPTGVTLTANGIVTVNRTSSTSFNYRASNGNGLSLPVTGAAVNLRTDSVPTTAAENCTYNRSGSGAIVSGSACAMTATPRQFTMNLIANDTDPNITTDVPTDGVGDAVVAARISSTGTGVAVSANTACGQAAIVKTASRATVINNCNGKITVTVNAAASASPISLTYRALDDLGAQSATRNDVVTVQ